MPEVNIGNNTSGTPVRQGVGSVRYGIRYGKIQYGVRYGVDLLAFYNEYGPYWSRTVPYYGPQSTVLAVLRYGVQYSEVSTVRGGQYIASYDSGAKRLSLMLDRYGRRMTSEFRPQRRRLERRVQSQRQTPMLRLRTGTNK